MAGPLGASLDESVGVLLQRSVVADVPRGARGMAGIVGRRAAGHRAGVLSRLDAGVIAEPADARLTRDAPEPIVDDLERAHERGPRGDGARAEGPHGEAPPPDVGLGERADGRAGEAAAPVGVHVWAD